MPAPNGPVKSLYTLSKNVLLKLVDTIDDVGDLDYQLLRPILLKITSPVQLKKLEANSPQIAGESVEVWKKLINRDFGQGSSEKYLPKNPLSWSKIYEKHQKEADIASAIASEALKAKMTSLTSAKASARARMITNTAGLPPTQRKRGDGSGWGRSADSWSTKAGSKTKNIVAKARREAKELSVFRGRNSRLAAPTHTLRHAEVSRNLKEKVRDPGLLPEVPAEAKKRGREVEDEDLVEEEQEQAKRGRMDERTAKWLAGERVATGKLNRGSSSAGASAVGASAPPRVRAPADPFMRRKQPGVVGPRR